MMHKMIIKALFLGLAPLLLTAQSSVEFDQFFTEKTMRIDYYLTGNSTDVKVSLDQVYEQKAWAGSKNKLIDIFNRGRYAVYVYDANSGLLLFSKGFNTYFGEYRTTDPAISGIYRTYEETLLLPFPRDSIRFEIKVRDKQNNLNPLFGQMIDPNSVSVIREHKDFGTEVITAVYNGDPGMHVDITIVAEGYLENERSKFSDDLQKFSEILLEKEPFKSYKDRFNIQGIFVTSSESGSDEPTKGKFNNTIVNTTFNSLSSPRYLLTENLHKVHDLASAVPSDFIVVLVNQKRYGGGGIYNSFATCTSDNEWSHFVFVHEFAHLFAGLADEYYSSATTYNAFYPEGVEPLEPNITALLDPDHVKWAAFIGKNIPVPTPWGKALYDTTNAQYLRDYEKNKDEIRKSISQKAGKSVIDSLRQREKQLTSERNKALEEILSRNLYTDEVGVFEGAGYSATGLYRPMMKCVMNQVGNHGFCNVCENALIEIIDYHSTP